MKKRNGRTGASFGSGPRLVGGGDNSAEVERIMQHQKMLAEAEAAEMGRLASSMTDEEVERLVAKFAPADDWVVLKLVLRSQTASGIMLPETAAMAKRWMVARVGPGVMLTEGPNAGTRAPLPVSVGQYLLFPPRTNIYTSEEYPRIGFVKLDPGAWMGVDERADSEMVKPTLVVS